MQRGKAIMIYTIGYEGFTAPRELLAIVARLRAVLIDVRSSPHSRKRGFGRLQFLRATEDADVQLYHRPELGGRTTIAKPDLARLAGEYAGPSRPNAVLMCMEHAPGDCHRHRTIARPLLEEGVHCLHICDDEVIHSGDLETAIRRDTSYDYIDLHEHLAAIERLHA